MMTTNKNPHTHLVQGFRTHRNLYTLTKYTIYQVFSYI
jgi:hypothetical protein